jgi:hypothetical protein
MKTMLRLFVLAYLLLPVFAFSQATGTSTATSTATSTLLKSPATRELISITVDYLNKRITATFNLKEKNGETVSMASVEVAPDDFNLIATSDFTKNVQRAVIKSIRK